MAWRAGAALFREMWPLIAARVEPDEFRAAFLDDLLGLLLNCDVDPTDLTGFHTEIDAALRRLGCLDPTDE
jgi:hypothetical protein